jgi:hypothetical protein
METAPELAKVLAGSSGSDHSEETMNRTVTPSIRITGLLLFALMGSAAATQAQVAVAGACNAGWSSFGALGIRGFSCDCTVTRKENDDVSWNFRGEPVVSSLTPGGPASGKLREGDVIVAINGLLITTQAAGDKVASLRQGEDVVLTIRRNGRVQEIEIEADEDCAEPATPAVIAGPPVQPVPPSRTTPRPSRTPRSARPPITAVTPAPMAPPTPPAPPSSWFGFGITCHNCEHAQQNGAAIERKEAELRALLRSSDRDLPRTAELRQQIDELRDQGSVWKFSEYPAVYSVDKDSPAEEAGLRRGDVLTKIDGIDLLTDEGGRRFASAEPGQTVTWTYRRGGAVRTAEVTAAEVPDNYLRPRLAELRSAVDRLRTTESGRQDAELTRLRAELERIDNNAPALAASPEAQHLRFAGMVGNTNVEVRGLSSVDVSYDNSTGELLIHTTDATIRIKAPPR